MLRDEMASAVLEVACIKSFDENVGLREEWDGFVESHGGDIYLTYDWCRVWWDVYGRGRDLHIFLFRHFGTLVGCLPMFVEVIWLGPVWLKIAKVVGCDYTLTMVNPAVQPDHASEIFVRVLETLFAVERCDAIWFGPIAENYPATRFVQRSANICSCAVVMRDRVQTPYSVFPLPDSFEKYLGRLSKGQRDKANREIKTLERSFVCGQDVISESTQVALEFDRFVRMHREQWRAENKLGHFEDWPKAVEFNSKVALAQAERGRLRLVRLIANDAVVSYELCYRFGFRWYWRLPARLVGSAWSKYSLGKVGLLRVIAAAIADGAAEVEGGAGHYDYKVKLGAGEYALRSILLAKSCARSRLRAIVFMGLADLLHFCYYRVWFIRLAPKLPFRRRSLWNLWIRTRL